MTTAKAITLRLPPSVADDFKALCTEKNLSQSELFAQMVQAYKQSASTSNPGTVPMLAESVCVCKVGDKLPRSLLITSSHRASIAIEGEAYIVLPAHNALVVKGQSANGNKKWLEVIATYPAEVMAYCQESRNLSASGLDKANINYAAQCAILATPEASEAIAQGWAGCIDLDDKPHYLSRSLAEWIIANPPIKVEPVVVSAEPAIISPVADSNPTEWITSTRAALSTMFHLDNSTKALLAHPQIRKNTDTNSWEYCKQLVRT